MKWLILFLFLVPFVAAEDYVNFKLQAESGQEPQEELLYARCDSDGNCLVSRGNGEVFTAEIRKTDPAAEQRKKEIEAKKESDNRFLMYAVGGLIVYYFWQRTRRRKEKDSIGAGWSDTKEAEEKIKKITKKEVELEYELEDEESSQETNIEDIHKKVQETYDKEI